MDDRFYPLDRFRYYLPPYPKLVFCDSVFGLFGYLVRKRTKGMYSHFMWELSPGVFASQGVLFKRFSLEHYRDYHLKFVVNVRWGKYEQNLLRVAIEDDLQRKWYSNAYDIIGVLGKLFGINEINSSLNFCSERGRYLGLVEHDYDLKAPTPSDLNEWTKARRDRFKVVGRYSPD